MESTTMDANDIVSRIESALREEKIDTLLIVSREDSDVVLPRILDVHVVAQTALFLNESFPFFNEIIAMEEEFEVEFLRVFERLSPRRLALTISEEDAALDGLRWGLYEQLRDLIGEERLSAMEVSGADVVRRALR